MNLHAIASAAIGVVNPNVPVLVYVSEGFEVAEVGPGRQVPKYAKPFQAIAQVQQLTQQQIRQMDFLNIQGADRAIYMNGAREGIVRITQKGGDLIKLMDGTVWLTTGVLERWPDWCAVTVTLQNQTTVVR